MEEVKEQWICGFWARIGALLVDSLILGLIGYMAGLLLEDVFVQLGAWGRLVGFSVSMMYFGILNSSVGNGQTIGKKLLKIKVVDASNSAISLPRSFLRYSFLAVPFSLNGARLTSEAALSYLTYPIMFIIFGGLFSISYLYIFNRVTRQSLHDLAVGSFVVKAGSSEQKTLPVWKPHFMVVAIIFAVAAMLPIVNLELAGSETIKNLAKAQKAMNQNDEVKYAVIEEGTNTLFSGEEKKITTYVNAQAFLYDNEVQDTDTALELARTIIETYPEAANKDLIQVTLSYGYDIGLASKWTNQSHHFDPSL